MTQQLLNKERQPYPLCTNFAFRGHFRETEARETAAEIEVVRLLLVGSSREACRQLVTVCQGNRNLRRQELLGFVQSRKRRRGFV